MSRNVRDLCGESSSIGARAGNKWELFEDNVQIASAELAGLDAIVTRDKAGFQGAPLPIFTPSELLQQLNQSKIKKDD